MARLIITRRVRSRRAKGGKRRRTGRFRLALVWLLVLGVAALGVGLYLDVAVTRRFDGRLWTLPSRIYSDLLVVAPGAPISPARVVERLERSGYARTADLPGHPGQYRRRGSTIDLYRRMFSTPFAEAESERVRVRFAGERVASIRDDRNRPRTRVALAPVLLATLYGHRQEERRLLPLAEIPAPMVRAVLAAEDARFYSHGGVDPRGILRAAWANLRQRRVVQGGSTITQQTVKNLFLGQQRTWWRKIRETPMALILDARYSKDRILEVYLNEVYLGQRGAVAICGVGAAARFYFGRDLQDLTLGEAALITGLIRSPGTYNPFRHPEAATRRRDQVLDAMARLGLAAPAEIDAARAEPLMLASGEEIVSHAPYAVDFVRQQLGELYEKRVLLEEGLAVYTTIDPHLQASAEAALASGLERLENDVAAVSEQLDARRLQGAIVMTRPSTGAIVAMVGGRDFRQSQFNRAAQARRQPGSCFKPFVYAAGFELSGERRSQGLTPRTLLDDSPLDVRSGGKTWRPANYDRRFRGTVTAREALEQSLNVPTVRAAQQVGLERVIATAQACGITSPLSALPSLALGTAEVTPLELAGAYGTFAHAGQHRPPWIIRAVIGPRDRPFPDQSQQAVAAISPRTAYLISDVLQGVFERGTARAAAGLGYHGFAAGKTGTTDDLRDAWFVGYTSDLLGLVWVGYDDNARTGLTGSSGALPVWVELMKRASPVDLLPRRRRFEDVVRVWIDPASGMPAGPRCPDVVEEYFARGSVPQGYCTLHEGRMRRWVRKLLNKAV